MQRQHLDGRQNSFNGKATAEVVTYRSDQIALRTGMFPLFSLIRGHVSAAPVTSTEK